MRWFDAMVRFFVLRQHAGARWLREELQARGVGIRLTESCIDELVRSADGAAVDGSNTTAPRGYVQRLRQELAVRAAFIQCWTGSDEDPGSDAAESVQTLVRIARKYALPRRWKLTEPAVVQYQRRRPSYFQWTRDIAPDAV